MTYSVPRETVEAGTQVFACHAGGRRVFVKKRRPAKNRLGWLAQRLLYRLSGNILLLPPLAPAADSAAFESGVLKRLAGLGARVPEVLHEAEDYFVMSDAGMTLETVLRDDPGRRQELIARAACELRRFHDLGVAHGGSQIKNLTLLDGEIYFIDFEENIPGNQTEAFQLRDVFLFLMSLERHGHDPDIAELCRLYDGGTDKGTFEKIRRQLLGLRLVRVLESRIFARFSMRDVRSLCRLVRKAEKV